MKHVALYLSLAMAFGAGFAVPLPAQAQEQKAIVLAWDSLLPEEDLAGGGSAAAAAAIEHDLPAEQSGSSGVVEELDGQFVRLPGFMLPLDYGPGGVVESFLLVPYVGACVHVPPPPPNQIVYVDTSADPVKTRGMWDAIWIVGTLRTKANINGLGDTAYTLELDRIETYEE